MNIKPKSFYIYQYDNKLDEPTTTVDIAALVNNATIEIKQVEVPSDLKKLIDEFIKQVVQARITGTTKE